MSTYLKESHGIIIEENYIISHILWADDLILFSDTAEGLQLQMDGLFEFCSKNKMIVNEMKTKIMLFGNGQRTEIRFNNKLIDYVEKYKYLGVIFNSIKRSNGDVFKEHTKYVKDKANKAIFSIVNKTKSIAPLEPKLSFFLFDTYVKPILTYGSEIIGCNKNYNNVIEKIHLRYLKNTLGVKSNTSTLKVLGDTGRLPLIYDTHSRLLSNFQRYERLLPMHHLSIIFKHMLCLTELGAITWIQSTRKIRESYNIFESEKSIKIRIKESLTNTWLKNINDIENNPGLKMYKNIKSQLKPEAYLYISNYKIRNSIAKIRLSSHHLSIERGRHLNISLNNRKCVYCDMNVLEDEIHFLFECPYYNEERLHFINTVNTNLEMSPKETFLYFFTSTDAFILSSLGKFITRCFNKRNT